MAEPLNLTPEEIAAYESAASQGAQPLNPVRDLSADDLFELATKDPDNFHLESEMERNKDLWGDPNTIQKVADVSQRIADRGFELSDIPGPGKIARSVFDIAKGFGKQAWNYAQGLVGTPIAGMVGEITGQGPGFQTALAQEGQRQVMENLAGTEQAVTGLATMGEKLVNKAAKFAGATTTPEQRVKNLWDRVGRFQQEQEISKGTGGLLEPLGGEVRKELEAAGKPIRPEEVSALAAGDPATFWTFGKAFQGVSKVVPARVGQAVEKVVEKAGPVAEQAAGKTLQAAGVLTELGGKTAQLFGPTAGAIVGTIKAGPFGTFAGEALGRRVQGAARKVAKAGEKAQVVGKEIAGTTPVTSGATQLAKDVVGAVPMAAAEVGKGLAFDIGTAALTSESPQDTQSVGIGAFFGGANALRRAGGRIISGQIVGPRAWGSDTYVPSSGKVDASFETMHNDALKTATPAVRTRLNAVREFLKGSNADTDVFLAKDSPSLAQALTKAGMDAQSAKTASEQEGFFQATIPGKDGTSRRVIFARNVDAAPHEAFHAIQDVLGEDANQMIDQIVRQEYGPQWEAEGQRYAQRIDPSTLDWRETILDSTGTGLDYAKEKVAMDVANEYRAATGAEPPSKYVQDRAKEIFGQTMDRALQANPRVDPNQIASRVWRDILSPQEAGAVADTYLARELAAENFDAVFKNLGASLNVQGLTGRLARVVANLASTLGIEPLSPERVSQIGKIAPKFAVTEAVRQAPGLVQPRQEPTVTPKPQVVPPSGKPVTQNEPVPPTQPAERTTELADEARTIAESAPETSPVAGTASPREILGSVAEAIAQQSGLKVNYLSAEGEGPAASISSNREARRAVIEAFRTMPPEARALWEKNFFPDRVIKLKGNKFQILGWAPEVFASNAHKLAAKLTELGVAEASPYPIAEGTFTPEGWKQLFEDTKIFVQNQMGGRTGAGEPLVVPKGLPGMFAPPERGQASPLEQGRADFISMLFGIKLPDTARVQKGKLPLNIAGQEVSKATKPGRTAVPVIPRGEFEGPEAQRQGIEGRQIMEVNPLRQQIEAAAQARGVAMPEFIEAQQRLNLENIKNVEVAPELPQFRANTLTLAAGFQPSSESRAVKSAAIRDERTGKVWTGEWHPGIFRDIEVATGKELGLVSYLTDGFVTNSGEFLTRQQALDRAVELKQVNRQEFEDQVKAYQEADVMYNSPRELETTAAKDVGMKFQFQPSTEPRAIKLPAVRDEKGKIYEGFWHGAAQEKAQASGAKGPFEDGFTTNKGEFLNRPDAFERAKELKQIDEDAKPGIMSEEGPGLENSQLMGKKLMSKEQAAAISAQFQPKAAEERAKEVTAMTPEQFRNWAQNLPKTGVAGFTEVAHKMGQEAPSKEFVDTLPIAQKAFEAKAEEAMKAGDFEKAMILASQQQFFREAWEAATGEGSAGFFLREKQPGFQPKFPIDKGAKIDETAAVKFQPKKAKPLSEEKGYLTEKRYPSLGRFNQLLEQGANPTDIASRLDFARDYPTDSHWSDLKSAVEIAFEYGSESQRRMAADIKDEAARIRWDKATQGKLNPYTGEPYGPFKPFGKSYREQVEFGLEDPATWNHKKVWDRIVSPIRDWIKNQVENVKEYFQPVPAPFITAKALEQVDWSNVAREYEMIAKDTGKKIGEGLEEDISDLSQRLTLDPTIDPNRLPENEKNLLQDFLSIARDQLLDRQINPVQFQPKEYELKPAKQGFSKAWILPNGKPVQLGGQWHHDFLNENDALRKQYGIPKTEGDENRVAALSKGFARINYDAKSGRLTVEAREADWPKLKRSVRDFVDANADKIDWIEVHLMDRPVEDVMHSDSAKVFQLEDNEKAAMTPFLDLSEGPKMTAASERLFNKATGKQFQPKEPDEYKTLVNTMNPDKSVRPYFDEAARILDSGVTEFTQTEWRKIPVKTQKVILDIAKFDINHRLTKVEQRGPARVRTVRRPYGEYPTVKDVAEGYAKEAGIEYNPDETRSLVPEDTAHEIADFFEAEKHNPEDPDVQKSYEALSKETIDQYHAIVDAGYQIEPWTKEGEPYRTSAEMVKDVQDNQHLYFKTTEGNFGATEADRARSNYMLEDSGVKIGETPLLVNDVFRAVHDFFGHAKESNQFGPKGEFNAWKDHSEMYSPEAQGALAAETLAQNFWVNFGKHLRNAEGKVPQKGRAGYVSPPDRPFAEQKNIVVPETLLNKVRAQFQPKEGTEEKKFLTKKELAAMTPEQLGEVFPEAVIPKSTKEQIPSRIVESPLYKRAIDEDAAIKVFGDKLAEFARQNSDDPLFKMGRKWYEEFTPQLKKEFGPDAELFAELLAATSPQTSVASNFGYAVDAIESFRRGRFTKIMAKFHEGLDKIASGDWKTWYQKELNAGRIPKPPKKPTPAAFMARWITKYNLKPTQTNGTLYGTHSKPVLQVFTRQWLTKSRGPKTLNFVENLLGTSDEATIDLWADRTMRRIGYEGEKRWRILPKNIMGVSDKDFAFSQKAFRHAANQLGMKPSSLQAALWFAEKGLWDRNGWSKLDLGDFREQMKRLPKLREGIEKRLKPKTKVEPR